MKKSFEHIIADLTGYMLCGLYGLFFVYLICGTLWW